MIEYVQQKHFYFSMLDQTIADIQVFLTLIAQVFIQVKRMQKLIDEYNRNNSKDLIMS
jgi:ABC-type Fe3+-hydroxamate transport system substrate-binding protein